MSFKDKVIQDVNVFLNAQEFAEEVTYTPSGSSAKNVIAVVVRENLQPAQEEHGRVLGRQAELYISADADDGIEEVTVGEDKVEFAIRPNQASVEWRVIDILAKSGGIWHLLVQK